MLTLLIFFSYNATYASVQKSDFGPIGHRCGMNGEMVRSSSLDSGYQSAADSEEANFKCRGLCVCVCARARECIT